MIEVAASTGSVADLESQVLDDPDDPDLHRELAEAVLAEGDEPRALEEFELGLAGVRGEGGLGRGGADGEPAGRPGA